MMRTGGGVSDRPDDLQDLQKISDLLAESDTLAQKGNYKFLAYLLNMARIEADTLLRGR